MALGAIKRIIDHFAALKIYAIPKIDQLLAEICLHIVFEDVRQIFEQGLFVGCEKQIQCFPIDIQNPDFTHALTHELRMDIGENAEIDNATLANVIHQLLYAAEILNPKRDG